MLKVLALGLLLLYPVVSVSGDSELYMNCNCDDHEGFWTVQRILESQRVSDFLIAVAYFSIPLELLYFVSFSNVPFKWVVVQFIAFIVLCGLTHLLNGWTYYGPHSFELMRWLTVAKFLTALVSCATSITLLTLIPLLLKWKVRELFLRQNVLELDQEVGIMKRYKEACIHVRMLTQEIRKSLDKHTIVDTTLVELSKTLDLQNCAVWMPNENGTEMYLTHELKNRSSSSRSINSVPVDDPDVLEIIRAKGVRNIRPDSSLAIASGGGALDNGGAITAIRMPVLHGSNFKGGTPDLIDMSYAILVLVLPGAASRPWSPQKAEIVEVVADQVAVGLSHAAVLEESQRMSEKLSELNRTLQQAKEDTMMANQARNSFQKVMSQGMRRSMHSILGLLSMFQEESMNFDQKIIVDALVKTSNVVSTLINDVMDSSLIDNRKYPLEIGSFGLHSMIREASCLAKCLCVHKGFDFELDVQGSLPHFVVGDEKRTFQLILYMVGCLLDIHNAGRTVVFRVLSEDGHVGNYKREPALLRLNLQKGNICLRFEVEIHERNPQFIGSLSFGYYPSDKGHCGYKINERLNFGKKLAEMMQGSIYTSQNSLGFPQSMSLVLRFNICPHVPRAILGPLNPSDQQNSNSQFTGMRVLLADEDDLNRTVTWKLLEKLGCQVTTASSGFECLNALTTHAEDFHRIVILELQMPDMDGFEIVTRIRRLCHSRYRPLVIALTASTNDHMWERCIQMGMNGAIQKPVSLQGLAYELRRVLQHSGE